MFKLSTILLPVDFSQRAQGAANHAIALTRQLHSKLVLVHVMLPLQYEVGTLEFGGAALGDLIANREGFARRQLDAFLLNELQGIEVERVLVEGDPAQKIVQYAHDAPADLVVMPTHWYGPFRRFILGSVTAKVLHDADCPVWTGVHLEEAASPSSVRVGTLLCALDLGEHSAQVLHWAKEAASAFGAKLSIVHAAPQIEVKPGEYFDTEWRQHMMQMAKERIAQLQTAAGSSAEVILESGEPAKSVGAVARRIGADLLVIGRGSAAGIFGRLRANAYAIIRESPCPVVSV